MPDLQFAIGIILGIPVGAVIVWAGLIAAKGAK